MAIDFNLYKTICFDCDGVILNSNTVKADAFYKMALPYGERLAEQFQQFHILHGGVSRYKKIDHFLKEMVPPNAKGPSREEMLDSFTRVVKEGLLKCSVADGLAELRRKNELANWCVVSGGDQEELREIFAVRGLSAFFNGGIFGSPATKEQILQQLKDSKQWQQPALFLGDSQYDHVVAQKFNIDFVFVSEWTEFFGYQDYCQKNQLPIIKNLKEISL